MNVLVCSGPSVAPTALSTALSSLRSLLLPNYTVQPLALGALGAQPWQGSCALLVLPHGAHRFPAPVAKSIKTFVEAGGRLLVLGAGAAAVSRARGSALGPNAPGLRLGEEGDAPLKLYDARSGVSVVCGEDPPEKAPRTVTLRAEDGTEVRGIVDAVCARFEGFDALPGVAVLARTAEGEIAGLAVGMDRGRAAFWGPSVEDDTPPPEGDSTAASSLARQQLLARTLAALGLTVPADATQQRTLSAPLPQFLTCAPGNPTIVAEIMAALGDPASITDASDAFALHPLAAGDALLAAARVTAQGPTSEPESWQPKHIVVCRDGALPARNDTPLFDIAAYYAALAEARAGLPPATPWGMGEALLYGEAVTSTQTMLDKNPTVLARLPAPLLSLASHQLAGRGRGRNVWLSPAGCLMFSLTLRVSLSAVPASKLVFVQYLAALALAEACRDARVLGPEAGARVRLKWPNDLYAVPLAGEGGEGGQGAPAKLGGVLVNTSFMGGTVDIVIGCGVNVGNAPPIASLAQLATSSYSSSTGTAPPTVAPSIERTAAAAMAAFERMWGAFVAARGSFAPFLDLYLERWMHSDQLVTLTSTSPPTPVRITGITLDHGLLRTVPARAGMPRGSADNDEYIDLQPDGNSFDLMAGLIKTKTS